MRTALSLLLVSALIVPVRPAVAQDVTLNPAFEKRLRNMAIEVESFETPIILESRGQETPKTKDSIHDQRIRIILLTLLPDTKIEVVLSGGETVRGRLAEVNDNGFRLFVAMDENSAARGQIKKELGFEQVERLEFSGSDRLVTPENAQEIPQGKKVEVLLLNGGTTKGRLAEVSADRLVLREGDEESHELTFNEIAAVRKTGMSTTAKILLISGLSFLAFGLVVSAMFGFQGT